MNIIEKTQVTKEAEYEDGIYYIDIFPVNDCDLNHMYEAREYMELYKYTKKEQALIDQGITIELVVHVNGSNRSIGCQSPGSNTNGGSPYVIPMFDIVREKEHREYKEYSSKTEFSND